MKNLALENYGVVELSQKEKEQEQGGIWQYAAIAAAFVISAINNWQDVREGFHDGLAGTPRH